MPIDPDLLRRLAICIQAMRDVLAHPDIRGIDARAMKGAMGAVQHIQSRRIALPQEASAEPETRPLFGIERSLPEGDRE